MATGVLLSDATAAPDRPAGLEDGDAWIALVDSYELLQLWEGAYRGVTRQGGGAALQEVAGVLRRPFLHAITELGRRHASPEWWTSRVSERNTQVSPLFLNVCRLRLVASALDQTEGTLHVVSDSPALLEAVAGRPGLRVKWAHAPHPRAERLDAGRAAFARAARFLLRGLVQRLRRPPKPDVPEERPLAVIRTYVDESCLGDDSFRDRYFPGLREGLEQLGFAVATIPVPFSLERSYADLWRVLRRAPGLFLAPEAYLGVGDYLWAMRAAWRQRRLPGGQVEVDGMDVTSLFDHDRRQFAFDYGSLDALLTSRLPRRLAERGVKPALIVETYENLIPEKGLILGLREALPDTRVVGFQHGALSPLLISSFVTEGEAEFAPLPDRVVCNGDFFRDVLVEEGLPAARAVAGPALRYAHLWDAPPAQGERERAVLVTLPLILDGATELLEKMSSALGPLEDVRVWIKAHPMIRGVERHKLLDAVRLPERFEWVEGGMGEWLGRAGALVALASSTLYEALAAGVPVVVVGRDTGLDLNPLAWQPELAPVATTPAELAAEVERLLGLGESELAELREQGRSVLEASFGRVGDDAARAFVDGLVELPRG